MDQELLNVSVSRKGHLRVRIGGIHIEHTIERLDLTFDSASGLHAVVRTLNPHKHATLIPLLDVLRKMVVDSTWLRVISSDTLPSMKAVTLEEQDEDE